MVRQLRKFITHYLSPERWSERKWLGSNQWWGWRLVEYTSVCLSLSVDFAYSRDLTASLCLTLVLFVHCAPNFVRLDYTTTTSSFSSSLTSIRKCIGSRFYPPSPLWQFAKDKSVLLSRILDRQIAEQGSRLSLAVTVPMHLDPRMEQTVPFKWVLAMYHRAVSCNIIPTDKTPCNTETVLLKLVTAMVNVMLATRLFNSSFLCLLRWCIFETNRVFVSVPYLSLRFIPCIPASVVL